MVICFRGPYIPPLHYGWSVDRGARASSSYGAGCRYKNTRRDDPAPMPKHLIKRFTPDHDKIRNHRHLRIFGSLLRDANLWHLNRRSAAGAFGVGLFMAFVPLPSQMLLAAAAAIVFRVNLPVSVALVWITNPITIPPMFFFAYWIGTLILGAPIQELEFELSMACLVDGLNGIWAPLLLGSLICASMSGLVGYFGIRTLWRLHVIRHMKRRRKRAEVAAPAAKPAP